MTARITESIEALLRQILNRQDLDLRSEQSLTIDLGLDSMQLMQFFSGIETLYPKVRLEEWFLDQSQEGQDTIGSLHRFIVKKNSSEQAFAA